MRSRVIIGFVVAIVVLGAVDGRSFGQTPGVPDSAASQTAPKRQGFFDYALGKINPRGNDYGASMASTRSAVVEDTIDDLYFWSNAVTLLMLCGLAVLVLLQWRAADKREVIAASLIAQLWNARVSDRIELQRCTEQFNRLVETHNAEVERSLMQKSHGSESEKDADVIRVAVLRSSVPTDKREDWYERQLKAGVEVVICHPKLVETGLDLLAFPTLYFYETGYSLHTLRQASRRSWRIGQRFPVRVKFVTYSGTMQETCLRLMGKKMLVALMMEGKFSGEGLQALDADEDLVSAMARELVEKAGVGESADAVWRDLGHEREKVLPRPAAVEPESEEETDLIPDLSIGDLPAVSAAEPVPTPFGIRLIEPHQISKKRKKAALWPTASETNAQLSLFD
jgi:hypothetical protein